MEKFSLKICEEKDIFKWNQGDYVFLRRWFLLSTKVVFEVSTQISTFLSIESFLSSSLLYTFTRPENRNHWQVYKLKRLNYKDRLN